MVSTTVAPVGAGATSTLQQLASQGSVLCQPSWNLRSIPQRYSPMTVAHPQSWLNDFHQPLPPVSSAGYLQLNTAKLAGPVPDWSSGSSIPCFQRFLQEQRRLLWLGEVCPASLTISLLTGSSTLQTRPVLQICECQCSWQKPLPRRYSRANNLRSRVVPAFGFKYLPAADSVEFMILERQDAPCPLTQVNVLISFLLVLQEGWAVQEADATCKEG